MFSIKSNLFYLLFIISFSCFSQLKKTADFGKPTSKELSMTSYSKDSEAAGVVLFSKGTNSIKLLDNNLVILKEVHKKIKVLDAKNFKNSIVEIYKYGNDKILNIKAITHNGNLQTYVKGDAYYQIDKNSSWSATRFTFPNIKDGSVLEYKYTLRTSYFFSFQGWTFQENLPVIYSEFNSEIPGNFVYKRVLYGNQKLTVNDVSVKINCFSVPNLAKPADCEMARYVMENIPAFIEENYMLSKENYLAKIEYDYISFHDFKGIHHKYSKNWKDVEREFKNDKDIGKQINNKSFFKSNLPEKIFAISDDLEKAKAIYTYIQKHYSWNENYGLFGNSRVKKAFEKKSGSSVEINLSLINALQAAGLKSNIAIHSTRENGLPKANYAVLTDFNYILAHLSINNKEYLLDASDKSIPFGIIPFETLNEKCRIMDFKKGSYWFPIEAYKKNIDYISANLIFSDTETISGNVNEIHTGYKAIEKRHQLNNISETEYISNKEKGKNSLEINDFTIENKNSIDAPLKEKYTVAFTPEIAGSKAYLFPFFLSKSFSTNPFTLNKRNYPVDLGYPISNSYLLTIDLNNIYEVEKLPENKAIKLAGDTGELQALYNYKDGKINLRFSFKLNDSRFEPEEYSDLKEFFNQVIEIMNNEPIILKKI